LGHKSHARKVVGSTLRRRKVRGCKKSAKRINTQKEDQRRKEKGQKIQTDRANTKTLKTAKESKQTAFEMQVSSAT
jgi:hypothetical protein